MGGPEWLTTLVVEGETFEGRRTPVKVGVVKGPTGLRFVLQVDEETTVFLKDQKPGQLIDHIRQAVVTQYGGRTQ